MQLAAMESLTPTSHLAGIISLCQVRCLGSLIAMPPLGVVLKACHQAAFQAWHPAIFHWPSGAWPSEAG